MYAHAHSGAKLAKVNRNMPYGNSAMLHSTATVNYNPNPAGTVS